jgi:hypothetical protein
VHKTNNKKEGEKMRLKTENQIIMIVNSVRLVVEKNSIDYLTKSAYEFLYLSSGFIAHYNLYGFMDHYRDVSDLVRDILNNEPMNRWENFRPGEKDYDYYHQKAEIYVRIVKAVEKARYPLFFADHVKFVTVSEAGAKVSAAVSKAMADVFKIL